MQVTLLPAVDLSLSSAPGGWPGKRKRRKREVTWRKIPRENTYHRFLYTMECELLIQWVCEKRVSKGNWHNSFALVKVASALKTKWLDSLRKLLVATACILTPERQPGGWDGM